MKQTFYDKLLADIGIIFLLLVIGLSVPIWLPLFIVIGSFESARESWDQWRAKRAYRRWCDEQDRQKFHQGLIYKD